MACVNPDGTLTESAKALLAILDNPKSVEEIAKELEQPLFKIRSSLREMTSADLVKEEGAKYTITEKGKEKV